MKQEILIPIIVASSALGGVIISQAFSLFRSFLDKRHEKQKMLRQKYEEMMFHFSASLEWIVHLNGSTNQESVFSLAQCSSARKALSLCLLYFREDLGAASNDYILSQQSYYKVIVEVYDKKDKNSAGGQAESKNPNYNEALKNLFEKKDSFENLIISNSSKYTKA